ncbi:MAG: bifunctional tetrahydrofolate synthase/dihydrofolate synthase [Alishewanella agri]|nr:bifunctional tetrahydrofolate synthase/dihydrofolate synthase [Alishewanella agri]
MSVQPLTSQSCRTLADWLCYIEQSHPIEKIELGLQRVSDVARRGNLAALPGKVVLIAGTNGKGTTARTLEQLLLVQGYRVGVYSSPHLLHFNERLRLNGQDVADNAWVEAFQLVEQLRQDIPLTYFEFTTLVAFAILRAEQPDFCLIEVGLGGRLDATNIVEPDISVVTTVDLDHQAFLGPDRETIGREKAGVFRPAKIAVCGDLQPPQSIAVVAESTAATLLQLNRDYHYQQTADSWQWQGLRQQRHQLPLPQVPMQNVATSLTVLEQLEVLPDSELLQQEISRLCLPGRMQWLRQQPAVLLDVAHNPQSAAYLAAQLQRLKPGYRRVYALVGMLKDKDLTQALLPLTTCVDEWHLVSLPGVRGAASELLAAALQGVAPAARAVQHPELAEAYRQVLATAAQQDLVVVFGSFVTVAGILALPQEE